ncbi:helix-turn-helix domain-containing protein [Streptomyces roseolus]|uniref:helix-turn-helix domain-containing protein n=1 Tax=Streptomyces TaxID=1883 RepID=UPI0036658996
MPEQDGRRKPRKAPLPPGPERTRTAAELRGLYEGEVISIRGLVTVTGWSYSTVRQLLIEAGTQFRQAGKH